ncbi:PHD finger protein 7-like [Podargus strigoides]
MELRSRRLSTLQPPPSACPAAQPEEQAELSCAPPPRRRARQTPKEEVCMLCRRADYDPEVVGQLFRQDRLCVHENCLYLASGLAQRGADHEGFYGFLFPDIRRELKRVARKRCCICQLRGASVTCQGRCCPRSNHITSRRRCCPRSFHLPCGSERGCVSQFFKEFKSFCWKHRPVQRVRAVQQDEMPCLICLEAVARRPCYDTLVCPTCTRAWFHRSCIQVGAIAPGPLVGSPCPPAPEGQQDPPG